MRVAKAIANNPRYIVIFMATVLLLSALGYSMFENKNLYDSCWWALVTGSTVGYGDTYPTHAMSRFIAVILMYSFIASSAFLFSSLFGALVEDKNIFTHEEQEEMKKLLHETVRELQIQRGILDPDGDGNLG